MASEHEQVRLCQLGVDRLHLSCGQRELGSTCVLSQPLDLARPGDGDEIGLRGIVVGGDPSHQVDERLGAPLPLFGVLRHVRAVVLRSLELGLVAVGPP